MIACPGCGLPREESQVGATPCPVCDAPPSAVAMVARPAVAIPTAPDPTANLPSDASQLHATAAVGVGRRSIVGVVLVFALGAGVGVGGLLGWQAAYPPGGRNQEPERDTAQAKPPELNLPRQVVVALAPMPHVPTPVRVEPKPDPTPQPPPVPKVVAPPDRAVIVPLDDPAAVHTVPPLKKGERFVLRGKVKTLRVEGLDAGAILDASGLEAAQVYVSGTIAGRSVLKLNAPGGVVACSARVAGKSSVEINAPAGDVRFSTEGARVDGGSTVAINGRAVELRGEVNGIETKVIVTIPGTGSLKVGAVRGIARVEYRVVGEGTPEVTAGTVSPTASFRKID